MVDNIIPPQKQCRHCQATKPIADFSPSSRSRKTPDGYDGWCKDCRRDAAQERRSRKPLAIRRNQEPWTYDEETWLDIPGYAGHYQVSDLGRVRSLDRNIIGGKGTPVRRKGRILVRHAYRGYPIVALSYDGRSSKPPVHALVALAFLGQRPEDHQVHHKNGNTSDNRPENLEYLHESDHHSFHSRRDQPSAKLTPQDVRTIRQLLAEGRSQGSVAREYRVHLGTINNIHCGRTWSYLEDSGDE